MATIASPAPASGTPSSPAGGQNYRGPFIIMTSLFFMWGFMTVFNDILIPRFKEAFTLNYFQAMLVQFAFFGAYAVGSIIYFVISAATGDPIAKIGYKNGIVIGLLISATGSALFWPAAVAHSYPMFLLALFVVGLGFAMLQIAANPYVTILGPEKTASSRLNLAQGFNSIGTTIGPLIGGWLIFQYFANSTAHGADSVKVPYMMFCIVFVALAVVFYFIHLPHVGEGKIEPGAGALKYPHVVLGILAIFMYVGGEVSVGSAIISFLKQPSIAGLTELDASKYVAIYWGGLMIGRFMGSVELSEMKAAKKQVLLIVIPLLAWLLLWAAKSAPMDALHGESKESVFSLWSSAFADNWSVFKIYLPFVGLCWLLFQFGQSLAARTLMIFSGMVVVLLLTAILVGGKTAMWCVVAVGLFTSIGWSNTFSLAIEGTGIHKSQGFVAAGDGDSWRGDSAAPPGLDCGRDQEPANLLHRAVDRVRLRGLLRREGAQNRPPRRLKFAMRGPSADQRVVMTLDAGGTNFRFSATRGDQPVTQTVAMPSNGDDLKQCLANIIEGFSRVKAACPKPPAAISFAFPGPADFPNGIIGDLGNLPGFRGGVALGPMLRKKFGIPAFINNDGDLFAYGEAIAGFLPYVNSLLKKAGSPKRFKNLVGLALGTGFGGGLARNGELFIGDNSMAGEVWLLRNKLARAMNAEEGASIRAVRRVYAQAAGIPFEQAPEPKVICEIGQGKHPGNKEAAREAFRTLGEVVGDAMGNALTLIDGLGVIGGGISGSWPLFLPALVAELNSPYTAPNGSQFSRLASRAFNLEDATERKKFLKGGTRVITVPGGREKVKYDPLQRIGVGISRLGTSEAVAIGAYAFAIHALDHR